MDGVAASTTKRGERLNVPRLDVVRAWACPPFGTRGWRRGTARKQALASMFFGKRPAFRVRTNFPDMSRQRE